MSEAPSDLWYQLRQAWEEYQEAKSKDDKARMEKLEIRIAKLQEALGIKGDESFKSAA